MDEINDYTIEELHQRLHEISQLPDLNEREIAILAFTQGWLTGEEEGTNSLYQLWDELHEGEHEVTGADYEITEGEFEAFCIKFKLGN